MRKEKKTAWLNDAEESLLHLPRDEEDLNITPFPMTAHSPRLNLPLIEQILSASGLRLLCLDGSISIFWISYLVGRFQNDQGDSTNYQAAATLIANSTNFGICVFIYPLISLIPIGSKLLGRMAKADEVEEAISEYSRLPRNTLLVGSIPAAFAMLSMVFSDQIWGLLGIPSEVIVLAQQFTRPLAALSPIIMLRFITDVILLLGINEKNESRKLMGITLTCLSAFGIFSSYFLGVGGIGSIQFTPLKILGVFLGFAAQMLVSYLLLTRVLKKSDIFKPIQFLKNLFTWTSADWDQIKTLTPLALTYLVTILAELLAQMIYTILAANLGPGRLAAQDFVAIINFFFLLWTIAIGQVTQQLVAFNFGKGDAPQAQKVARYGLGLSFLPAPLYILLALKPRWLTDLTPSINDEVRTYTDFLIPYGLLNSALYTLLYVMIESLKSTGKFFRPVALAIIGLWGGVAAAFPLSKSDDIYGVARASVGGVGLAAFLTSYYWGKNFLMATTETYPEAEGSRSRSQIEYIETPEPPVSSNRYGCFGCFRRLYKHLLQPKTKNLTESRHDLQSVRS